MFDDSEFKSMVLDEVVDHAHNVDKLVQGHDTNVDNSFFKELFRILHSIKGTSKSGGFDSVAHITHLIENLVGDLKDEKTPYTEDIRDYFLDFADELAHRIEDIQKDMSFEPNFDEFETRLNQLMQNEPDSITNERPKILIVDDEKGIVDLIEGYVHDIFGQSARVDRCYDGDHGSKCICDNSYDLIVLDFRMEGKDGLVLLDETRRDIAKNRETPIIFLSGYHPTLPARKETREKVYFVEKPFSFDSFNFYCKLNLRTLMAI